MSCVYRNRKNYWMIASIAQSDVDECVFCNV